MSTDVYRDGYRGAYTAVSEGACEGVHGDVYNDACRGNYSDVCKDASEDPYKDACRDAYKDDQLVFSMRQCPGREAHTRDPTAPRMAPQTTGHHEIPTTFGHNHVFRAHETCAEFV